MEPFHELFFHMVESRLSRSLFTNFSFTWWNLGYHRAFSRTFLSHGCRDSPKGPLNNQGETRLKPAKNAKHKSTCTPKAHIQCNHDPGAPRGPPGQHSRRPSSEVRLARGIDAPSGGDRLARGLHAPRAGSALLEGSTPPLERGPPRSRVERPHGQGQLRSKAPTRTCSRTRVRAFNALTSQGRAPTLTRLRITPRRCSANSQGEAIPAAVQHCAARPVSAP
jgi:hypothetical protein